MASSGFKLAAELSSLIFIIWHRCEEMVRMHFGSCRRFIRQNDSAVMHSGKNNLIPAPFYLCSCTLYFSTTTTGLQEKEKLSFFSVLKSGFDLTLEEICQTPAAFIYLMYQSLAASSATAAINMARMEQE